MNGFLHLLLSLSLGGSLMALLLLGLRLLLRAKLPSVFYYYAWMLVLLRLVLPLPGFLSLGGQDSETRPAAVYTAPADAEPVRAPSVPALPSADNGGTGGDSYYGPGAALSAKASLPEGAEPEETAGQAELSPVRAAFGDALDMLARFAGEQIRSGSIWGWLWAAGAGFTLVWYMVGYFRFSRALRRTLCRADLFERHLFLSMGGPRRLQLCRSYAVNTPMLLGLFHPVLVLPDRDYSEEMLRNILNHELTHYRRHDLVFKWLAVAVTAIHWFNPIVHIARRELDRTCEMSCDEKLLRKMDKTGKQSYGETLLSLAADNALPRRLVATTFATEKRNLRERLEQIMTYKHIGRTTLALMLAAALLLGGCATVVGPQASTEPTESPAPIETAGPEPTEAPVPTPEPRNVTVSTVDELLAAIDSNTNITLLEGTYNLAEAGDYGQTKEAGPYAWEETYDPDGAEAYELVISNVTGLTLMGEGEVTIAAVPRYANVLSFSNCSGLCLAGLSIGHTEAPGQCTGGVVKLRTVDKAIISQCRLFGCGTIGVDGKDCTELKVVESEIYDCSYSAALFNTCRDVLFNHCTFRDSSTYTDLIQLNVSDNCAIINSTITGNDSPVMLSASYCTNTYFAGNRVEDNKFSTGLLYLDGQSATVEGCRFDGDTQVWYAKEVWSDKDSLKAVSAEGKELEETALAAMELVSVDSWQAELPVAVAPPAGADGAVHVSTVDEFLAAIASDTTIVLEDGVFDLSTASNYGGYGGNNYVWYDTGVDGPQLVISGVENLRITGSGADKVSILAVPRYAEVLAFEDCRNISLEGFTAGHSQAPGNCTGGVIYFAASSKLSIEGCSLYGCGVWGVTGYDCDGLSVKDTEIYDCSYGDINLNQCRNVSFEGCDIHDNGPSRVVLNCTNVTIDGKEMIGFAPPSVATLNAEIVNFDVYQAHAKPTLYINYQSAPITELTLPIGVPIELKARCWGAGADPEAEPEVKWSLSGSGCELTERKHSKCILENINGKSGSVTLTAEAEGQTAILTVNLTAAASAGEAKLS